MPDVTLILLRRHRRVVAHRKNRAGKIGFIFILFINLSFAIFGIFFTFFYAQLTADLPSPESLQVLIAPPAGQFLSPTKIYDRSGENLLLTLENPAATGHRYLPITQSNSDSDLSYVIAAVIASTDPLFWHHPGFTLSGILSDEPPTLAQRLVSEYLLWDEPVGLKRDLRERILAAQITAKYGREQVLEWYINTANFGRLANGIDAAALVYFGKSAENLELSEAALLAAIPNAPALNPHDTLQASIERQKSVLTTMQVQGLISKSDTKKAMETSLDIMPPENWSNHLAPDFVQYALRQLAEQFGWARLERGGYQIITTLDYELQQQVQCVTQIHFNRLIGQPDPVANDIDCSAAFLLPTLNLEERFPADGFAMNVGIYDPNTGQILALVSNNPDDLEHAIAQGKPPGTLLTPMVYLTAFTRGFNPSSLVWDIPNQPASQLGEVPSLDDGYQGPMRLRNALANDVLVPAVHTMLQVGSDNVWRTATQLGLDSLQHGDDQKSYQTLWQGGAANLIEILQVYGTIANEGVLVGQADTRNDSANTRPINPVSVLTVQTPDGDILLDNQLPDFRPVISSQLAYLMTNVLSDEPVRWRTLGHPNPLEIGRPVAAKLGQTIDNTDGWAIGYTPELAVGVWLGSAEGSSLAPLPEAAGALWHAVIQYASRNQPVANWDVPPGISMINVCDPSGLLPTSSCPNVIQEVFVSGNEPTQTDNLYKALEINRASGLLATINTPPELIEEKIFLAIPPEAEEWAVEAGIPIPPEDYDLMLSGNQELTNLMIIEPNSFGYVKDKVEIFGTAAGPNFDYYRLQVGQGLNPQSWVQVGEDVQRPVRRGVLGVWDTSGSDGLFVIQLLRVNEDQRIDTTSIQVTVDNQQPTGSILLPEADQIFDAKLDAQILIQVDPNDNIGIHLVQFMINDRLIGEANQKPYTMVWSSRPGTYKLSVIIEDIAGNQTILQREFQVSK